MKEYKFNIIKNTRIFYYMVRLHTLTNALIATILIFRLILKIMLIELRTKF